MTGPRGSLFKSRLTTSAEGVERPQSRKDKTKGQAGTAKVTMKWLLNLQTGRLPRRHPLIPPSQ